MYTCSHPHERQQYVEYFKTNGIHFNYINHNPEVESEGYGYYEDKPYFNVLFEDKSGFDAHNDWEKVLEVLKRN